MAEDITLTMDGLLLNWLKDVGENISAGEVIAEFEADKATVEVESPADGVLIETLIDIGEEVDEGTVIARVGAAGESAGSSNGNGASAQAASAPEPVAESVPAEPSTNGTGGATTMTADGRIKVSPLARRIAEDKGINLAQVSGTGPGGRIVKADVENFDPSKATPAKASAPAPAPASSGGATATMSFQSYGKLPEGDDVEIE
ncbi:MAG: E3 binding domain-containing protein, partial [Chloroflexota bacterium]